MHLLCSELLVQELWAFVSVLGLWQLEVLSFNRLVLALGQVSC